MSMIKVRVNMTGLIFTKLMLVQQLFALYSCITFHENPAKNLISDTRSET